MAEIVFYCGDCRQKFTSVAETAGTVFACQSCGAKVTVPTARAAGTQVPAASLSSGPAQSTVPQGTSGPPGLPRSRSFRLNHHLLELRPGAAGDLLSVTGHPEDHLFPLDRVEKVVAVNGDSPGWYLAKLIILIGLLVSTAGIGVIVAFFLGLTPTRRRPTLIFGFKQQPGTPPVIADDLLALEAAGPDELAAVVAWLQSETSLRIDSPFTGAQSSQSTGGGLRSAAGPAGGQGAGSARQVALDPVRILAGAAVVLLFGLLVAGEILAATGRLSSAVRALFFALTAGILFFFHLLRSHPELWHRGSRISPSRALGRVAGVYAGAALVPGIVICAGALAGFYHVALPGSYVARAEGRITAAAVNQDSTRVIAATDEGRIGVWDLPGGSALKTCPVTGGTVTCVNSSADGRTGVAAWKNGDVVAWETTTGAALKELHTGRLVSSVAVANTGSSIVVGFRGSEADLDGEVWLYQSQVERVRLDSGRLGGHVHAVGLSPDGKLVAAVYDRVRGANMTSIRVFDPEKKGQYSGYFDCDSLVVGAITTIAFDSTGKQIATGSSKGWIHAGRLTAGGRFEIAASNAGQHGVLSVRFAPRGDRLVCSRKNGDVEIWPANLHSQIFRFNTGSRPVLIAFIASGERELFYSDATPFLKRLVLPGGD